MVGLLDRRAFLGTSAASVMGTSVAVPRVLFPRDNEGLPEDETTIAEMLKPRGYRSACVGQWRLGHHEEHLPASRGFDEYFGIPYSNDRDPPVGSDQRLVGDESSKERRGDRSVSARLAVMG
jgi:arylsulfatase A-like enzyme